MRTVVRIMLLLAAMAYLAMPFGMTAGMAQAMPVDMHGPGPMADDTTPMHHGMDMAAVNVAPMNVDCPHQAPSDDKSPVTSLHCTACLTLAADIRFLDAGKPARAVPPPAIARAMLSVAAAPLDPPPRS